MKIAKHGFPSLWVLSVVLLLSACTQVKEELPNILYILADDMGYGDLGCLNPESKVPTPNMDLIAEQGLIFTDAHSPSAVCTPTRYGILTGRYCFRTRLKSGVLVGFSPPLIEDGRLTVADILRESGYYTACIGKWHLGLEWPKFIDSLPLFQGDEWGPSSTSNVNYAGTITGGPTDHGFDYSFIIPASLDMTPYCYISNKKLVGPMTGYTEGLNEPRGVFWRPGNLQEGFQVEGVLERITEQAIQFIDQRKDQTNPFFLYLPLTAPHTPWLPNKENQGSSGAGIYGDFVHMVDQTVGKIHQALINNKLFDNTLLIVTSDNGAHWTPSDKSLFPHEANAHFSGMKSDAWEGGHRVPFILQWPNKVKPGTRSNQVMSLTDLMATAAAITGYQIPVAAGEDSYNMLPAILGEASDNQIRTNTIHHSISGVFAIRIGDFKFIDGMGSGGWSSKGSETDPPGQLYNIKKDPQEQLNLYLEMPEMVTEMKKQLDKIKAQGHSKPD